MTTQTKQERAAQSIRGYRLTRLIGIRCNDKTIRTAQTLGIINVGHKISDALGISSWIDQKLNEEIDKKLQKLLDKKEDTK